MGSWGTGIFHDDFALDIRGFYEELVSLKFADEAILREMQQAFGMATEGIEESTFWIALALSQHKFGRLDAEVKSRALHLIDSGRALQDWVDLDGESVPSRKKELLKARSTIDSASPKRKTPRPSQELRQRIDRTYSNFPWKEGGLYAYRLESGEYVVLAAARVLQLSLGRHYQTRGDGLVPVDKPTLSQPVLLLLDYRNRQLPSKPDLETMLPFVRPIKVKDRKEHLKIIDELYAEDQAEAGQSFEDFARENREEHSTKTDEQFHAHYLWWMERCNKRRDFYADREEALKRFFYVLLIMDPKQPVPVDRLVDLEITRRFAYEDHSISAEWATLDSYLVARKPLDESQTVMLWPAD